MIKILSFKRSISLLLCIILCYIATSQGPFNIGTIHPGDSIVIMYDVTINNPLVPPNAPSISNQGTVSGSNFSNILTDDPDTGPAGDPTITILNMFPLPVTLTELKASQQVNTIVLQWKVESEFDLEKYVVERSTDGRTFVAIGEVPGKNLPGTLHYAFTDLQPSAGNNFYRLQMVDIDGKKKYSMVVRVKIGGVIAATLIFPNPVSTGALNIQMQNRQAGVYTVRLFNSVGQVVFQKQLNHPGGSSGQALYLPQGIIKGYYQLEISGKLSRDRFKLVIQ